MERERRDMANEIARLEADTGAQAEDLARLTAALAEKTTALGDVEKTASAIKIEKG